MPASHSSAPESDERLNAAFAALADPTRRAILARLTQGEANMSELAEPFAMSQPAISRHIKVLESAGLIERSRDAQSFLCRLAPASPLKDVADFALRYRPFWDQSFDKLDAYLLQLQPHRTARTAASPATPAKRKPHVRQR